MGVVALVCVLVGLLALTVFRPPARSESSVRSSTDLVMTRDGVLPLVKDDVTVTATSASGAEVTLIFGTTQDVKGWIGDAAYTEVVGLEANREALKTQVHDAIGAGATQAQSGSGASNLAEQLAGSDMWLARSSGEGSASLDLVDVPQARSVLAVSTAGAGDVTLTLSWVNDQSNTPAIIAFLAALVFALIALVLFLTRWQLLRHRVERARRIDERRRADGLETSSIDSHEVAKKAAALRDEETARVEAARGAAAESDGASSSDIDAVVEAIAEETGGALGSDADGGYDDPAEWYDAEEAQEEPQQWGPPQAQWPSGDDGASQGGRHGIGEGVIDEDPPQTEPTDTGIIDLSAIRPGVTLPSRRALREAREKGEHVLVVDGQEYDTGLIPAVSDDEDAQGAAPTGAADDDASATGGWTSIMSGWLSDGGKAGK
ncbi:hypothetical protein EHS14_11840 [Schaalia georgiae]|nr:hypothetical protein EHS14_11840 [Schaalia georgiae]